MKVHSKVQQVEIDLLVPFDRNPRFRITDEKEDPDPYKLHDEYFRTQYKDSPEKIILNLLNPEIGQIINPLIVFKSKKYLGKYEIFDGNRRYFGVYYLLRFIKEKKLPDFFSNKLEKEFQNNKSKISKYLSCFVCESEADAIRVYEELDREKPWETLQKWRNDFRIGMCDLNTALVSFMDHNNLSNNIKKPTNIERVFSNPKFIESFNIKRQGQDFIFEGPYDKEYIIDLIKYIDKNETSRSLNKSNQIIEFIDNYKINNPINQTPLKQEKDNSNSLNTKDSNSNIDNNKFIGNIGFNEIKSAFEKENNSINTKKDVDKDTKKFSKEKIKNVKKNIDCLFEEEIEIDTEKAPKLSALYDEIKNFKIKNRPHIGAFALRAFYEITMRNYLQDKRNYNKDKIDNLKLHQLFEESCKLLGIFERGPKYYDYKTVHNNINSFVNKTIHHNELVISVDTIKDIAKKISPFLKQLIEGINS